jgi:hypothetical protein
MRALGGERAYKNRLGKGQDSGRPRPILEARSPPFAVKAVEAEMKDFELGEIGKTRRPERIAADNLPIFAHRS